MIKHRRLAAVFQRPSVPAHFNHLERPHHLDNDADHDERKHAKALAPVNVRRRGQASASGQLERRAGRLW